MEEDPLEQTVDSLVDGAAIISSDLKKRIAIETLNTYGKAIVATAKVAPVCLALGATPAISQAQAREPEAQPHVPSQSQATNPLGFQFYATSTSGESFSLESYVFKTFDRRLK
jgi:hypothetical protein